MKRLSLTEMRKVTGGCVWCGIIRIKVFF